MSNTGHDVLKVPYLSMSILGFLPYDDIDKGTQLHLKDAPWYPDKMYPVELGLDVR